MADSVQQVAVTVALGERFTAADLDRATRLLRSELAGQPDVASAELVDDPSVPADAKGGVAAQAGELVLGVLSVESLRRVVGVLRAWLGRDADRTARLSIGGDVLEVSGITVERQDELVDAWLRHVAGGGRRD